MCYWYKHLLFAVTHLHRGYGVAFGNTDANFLQAVHTGAGRCREGLRPPHPIPRFAPPFIRGSSSLQAAAAIRHLDQTVLSLHLWPRTKE